MLTIRFDSTDQEASLQSLYRWLVSDSSFNRVAQTSLASRSSPDAMGGAWDVIQILFSDGMNLASLAVSFFTWHSSRPKQEQGKFVIVIRHSGTEVTIKGNDLESVDRMIEILGKSETEQ